MRLIRKHNEPSNSEHRRRKRHLCFRRHSDVSFGRFGMGQDKQTDFFAHCLVTRLRERRVTKVTHLTNTTCCLEDKLHFLRFLFVKYFSHSL